MFGGSFHLGHFLIARSAREKFRLQEVVFIPCAHSPLKKHRPTASQSARMAMLRSGLRGQSWARIWDGEIRHPGLSYTVDTVRHWRRARPGSCLFWILGSDQWKLLPSWKHPKELARDLHFLVFPRPERPRNRRGFRMREIPFRIDLSATEVRERIRKKLPIQGLVLPAVEGLIRRKGWYR